VTECVRFYYDFYGEGAHTHESWTRCSIIRDEINHTPNPYRVALAVGTILLSWTFMHTIFALHYAHEFYGQGRDDRIGGLVFPGDEDPDYWDFLYYSLVVAMTAQVSDVQITSKTIRRLTTVHGAVSFFFNATVLALTVNIVSSLMQPNGQ
jgi:uncharacterized membrane protein